MGLDLALPRTRRSTALPLTQAPTAPRHSVPGHPAQTLARERHGVWPVAALTGALTAAGMAACAWCFARSSGARMPWVFTQWVAEHALWGTAVGAFVALVVGLGRRADPVLNSTTECRAAACRLALWCVSLGFLCLLSLSKPSGWSTVAPAVGLLIGGGISYLSTQLALGAWGGRRDCGIHPARAAVLILLLTLPLAPGARTSPDKGFRPPDTLWEAWNVMLGA